MGGRRALVPGLGNRKVDWRPTWATRTGSRRCVAGCVHTGARSSWKRGEALRLFYVLISEALRSWPELAQEFAEPHASLRAMTVGMGWRRDRRRRNARRRRSERRHHLHHRRARRHRVPVAARPGGFDLDRVYEDLEKTLSRGCAARRPAAPSLRFLRGKSPEGCRSG